MSTTHNSKTDWHERFYLYRQTDVTGVSGTGTIAEGVRFSDGVCVLRWCVPDQASSTAVYGSIVDVIAIHGHNGSTVVMWLDTTDEPEDEFGPRDSDYKLIACQVDETVGEGDHQTVYGKAEADLGALMS